MTNQHMMSHWKTMDECHWHSKSQMLVQQHTACLWTTWTKRCVQCRTKCDDWCAEMLHLVQACGHNPTKSIQILLQHCHKAIHPQSLAQCVPSKPDNVFNIWCWCEQWFVWFVWHVHTLGILLLFFVSETVLPRMMLKCFFFVLSALQTKWTQMIVWVMQVKNYFKCAWKTKGDEIDGCRWNLSVIQPQFPSFQRLLVVFWCDWLHSRNGAFTFCSFHAHCHSLRSMSIAFHLCLIFLYSFDDLASERVVNPSVRARSWLFMSTPIFLPLNNSDYFCFLAVQSNGNTSDYFFFTSPFCSNDCSTCMLTLLPFPTTSTDGVQVSMTRKPSKWGTEETLRTLKKCTEVLLTDNLNTKWLFRHSHPTITKDVKDLDNGHKARMISKHRDHRSKWQCNRLGSLAWSSLESTSRAIAHNAKIVL